MAQTIVEVLDVLAVSRSGRSVPLGNVMPVMIIRSAAAMNLLFSTASQTVTPPRVLTNYIGGQVCCGDFESTNQQRIEDPGAVAPDTDMWPCSFI